jgi:hypothetical protein
MVSRPADLKVRVREKEKEVGVIRIRRQLDGSSGGLEERGAVG